MPTRLLFLDADVAELLDSGPDAANGLPERGRSMTARQGNASMTGWPTPTRRLLASWSHRASVQHHLLVRHHRHAEGHRAIARDALVTHSARGVLWLRPGSGDPARYAALLQTPRWCRSSRRSGSAGRCI